MSTEGLCLQARYNQWMNERLYAVTASLPEAVRRRDLGAFFKSLHGTFNHILLVDRLWIGRMTGHPCHFDSLDQELYRDFEQLRMQQRETDADLLQRVHALTAPQLARRIDYISLMTGQPKSLQLGTLLTHVFHHQTHHRGQITTLLSQLGVDFGETDMIWMPDVN